MPFNVSGPFLAQFGINQLHLEGALLVQGKKILLVASLKTWSRLFPAFFLTHLFFGITKP
jgi:hypothetical protein